MKIEVELKEETFVEETADLHFHYLMESSNGCCVYFAGLSIM
jgi:hypothetical protein